MKEPVIVASVLGADYARLGHEVAELEAAGVDRIQWDIMDGRFVPNLTFGAEVVGACRPHATVPFEAHLMVEDPDQWLQPFAAAGCETVLVHHEACRHLHRTLSRIRERGVRSGVALNPAPRFWKAGAELLVAGSAILAHPAGRSAAVAELRRSLQPNVQAPSEERAVH
jgi:ribulose-phosphate 3-epimerase